MAPAAGATQHAAPPTRLLVARQRLFMLAHVVQLVAIFFQLARAAEEHLRVRILRG